MKIFSHGPEPGGCGLTLLGDDGLLAVRALERLLLGKVVLKCKMVRLAKMSMNVIARPV